MIISHMMYNIKWSLGRGPAQQSHCAATRRELINAALHTNINFNIYQLGYCRYIIGVYILCISEIFWHEWMLSVGRGKKSRKRLFRIRTIITTALDSLNFLNSRRGNGDAAGYNISVGSVHWGDGGGVKDTFVNYKWLIRLVKDLYVELPVIILYAE